jgi:hypothetical protein
LLDGFYKVEFSVNGASGRSVMYARDGILLGGGSAFAHIGTYEQAGADTIAELVTRRHNNDPRHDSLLGSDDATLKARGRADADGEIFRFESGSEGGAVRLRAGQNVVHVGIVAAAVDDAALLVERRLLGQIVLAVQLGDVLGDGDALGVLPWALADAIARIDRDRAAGRLRER